MATVTGLNAIGSGNTASMATIGQKTPAEILKAAQTTASKAVVVNATIVDDKPAPGELAIGQVVKLTNDNGKVEYYVGTATGGVSKATSVSSAASQVTTQVTKAEKIQTVALKSSNKIEESELKQSLLEQGLTPAQIKPILAAEKASNTADVAQLASLLSDPGLQYGVRDTATNTFVNNVVNGVTTQAAPPASLLTYNDPVYSAPAQTAIQKANDSVAEFQLLHGITQPFEGKGNTQSGIDPYHIYQALDGNHIETIRDPVTGAVTDYKFSEQVAKAKGDQSGLMNAIDGGGFGKYEARVLGQILSNNALINQPVAVSTDAKGNLYVNATTLDANGRPIAQKDANGNPIDRYATQNALVDTGRTIQIGTDETTGQPIYGQVFSEVATDNSKRNYVSLVSNYIKKPDGTFVYGGVEDMSYTHVEGFDPIKALVIAGISAGFGAGAGALSGLSGSAATAVGGAVGGATGAALSGSNILKGALLGGLGGFTIGEVQAAAKAAGGYTKLLGQVGSGNLSSFTKAAQDAAAYANSAAGSASGVDGGGGGYAGGNNQASIDFGDTSVAQGGFPNATNLSDTTVNDYLNKFNADGTLKTIDFTTPNSYTDGTKITGGDTNTSYIDNALDKFKLDNWSNNQSTVENFTGGPATNNGIPGVNPDGTFKQIDLSNSDYYTDGTPRVVVPSDTGGLLDKVKDLGSNLVNTLGTTGTIAATGLIANTVANALKPNPPAPTTYTAPLLVPGKAPMTQVPDFRQNYNNLFNRQGVGAGQYLGYDFMNRINVPPELMGLLGTSAQALPTPTTTTA